MKDTNNETFPKLFREAYRKCFGFELTYPLTETESRNFSSKIFNSTGLVVGPKSLKNYSLYVLAGKKSKHENPSIASLDTLSRYVLGAAHTDEVERKAKESHFPYWFQYRDGIIIEVGRNAEIKLSFNPSIGKGKLPFARKIIIIVVIIVTGLLAVILFFPSRINPDFVEDFHTVQEDSIVKHGWFLKTKDELWWSRRDEMPSHLTLFTLRGDNWTDSSNNPGIKNLLLRKINAECFTTEIQLDNFIPLQRWQQAGILLMEDTAFLRRSLRISIAYNDFFGGYIKPGEIIIQAINSNIINSLNPEEIIHFPIMSIEPGKDSLVKNNLKKSALKIEKNGNHFRFLYGTGQAGNFSFKEVMSKDLQIQPKYIGLFALQGFVNDTNYYPAFFKYFKLIINKCDN